MQPPRPAHAASFAHRSRRVAALLLAALAVGGSVAGCGGSPRTPETPPMNERTLAALATPAALLVGPRWAWQGAADPGRYTVAFGPAGRLEVVADCNRGEGRFEVDGARLHIGDLALTKKLCGRDSEERAFREALAGVTGYRRAGDTLQLSIADGRTLAFRAMR